MSSVQSLDCFFHIRQSYTVISSCPFCRQENTGKSSEAPPHFQQKSSVGAAAAAAATIVFALLFFYMQALYEYDGTCTETLFGLLVCGLSAISWNVYICTKPSRYRSRGRRMRDTRRGLRKQKSKKKQKKHVQMFQCLIQPWGCFQFKFSSVG